MADDAFPWNFGDLLDATAANVPGDRPALIRGPRVISWADFDARTNRYVIAGGDLRNFVGDTSRPASDKTLRGALKPYLDHLLDEGLLAADGESAAFAVTAALVAGQQVVPVGGAIDVRATRRGRTSP